MIELIIVVAILAILGSIWYVNFSSNIDDSNFSNENTKLNQAKQQVDRLFLKDFWIDWTTDSDHKVRYIQNQGSFDVGTIDASDSSDLSYTEAWQVFVDSMIWNLNLSASEFDVQVCDRDVSQANLDAVLNTKTTWPYYELVIFTDSTATLTDCTWTITAWTTQIAWYTFRYKNAKLQDKSDDYESAKKNDGWSRISATAVNTAWEDTVWTYTPINNSLTVTNKGI